MNLPATVEDFLTSHGTRYSLVQHPRAATSRDCAARAHVPLDHVAKAVILNDAQGFVMAVVPADHWLRLKALREDLDRALKLTDEREINRLFRDCVPGAVPPLGPAYGLETLVDDDLMALGDVYFEAGDHEQLVHTDGESFRDLLRGARHGHISHD